MLSHRAEGRSERETNNERTLMPYYPTLVLTYARMPPALRLPRLLLLLATLVNAYPSLWCLGRFCKRSPSLSACFSSQLKTISSTSVKIPPAQRTTGETRV